MQKNEEPVTKSDRIVGAGNARGYEKRSK